MGKICYKKIKAIVKEQNCLVINSLTIAAEATKGGFAWLTCIANLYNNIKYNLYHKYYYHYLIGVSSGSVCINLILNTVYLYENYGKKKSMEYMEALFDFLTYDNLRNGFFDTGNGMPLNIFNSYKIIENVLLTGGFFSRAALIEILNGTAKGFKFNNDKNYFTSSHYYKWINKNIDNVFIGVNQTSSTILNIYSGSKKFPENSLYINYQVLNAENFQEVVLASSSIIFIYPTVEINSTDNTTDGGNTHSNINEILQALIVASYHLDNTKLYGPIIDYFNIDKDNFLIIHNKINLQNRFENIQTFNNTDGPIPVLNSFNTLLTLPANIIYFAQNNVAATSILISQPYIPLYSTSNFNDCTKSIYNKKTKNIKNATSTINTINKKKLNTKIPSREITKKEFNILYKDEYKCYKQYMNLYYKYIVLTTNLIESCYLYNKTQVFKYTTTKTQDDIKVHLVYFDIFMRNCQKFPQYFDVESLLNINRKNNKQNIQSNRNLGVVMGNIWFNVVKAQQYTSFNDLPSTKNVYDISELLYEAISRDINISEFD